MTQPALDTRLAGLDLDGDPVAELLHDIRHALATISLLAAAVGVREPLSAEGRTRLQRIGQESQAIGEMIRAFDTGASRPERTDVAAIAGDVVAAARLVVAARVSLVQHGDSRVVADPVALRRAIANLVDNAARSAGDEGQVRVRVVRRQDGVRVEVEDDGPGFGAAPPGYEGRGLSVVRSAVATCGGSLDLGRSRLGGARVRITLPAPGETAPAIPLPQETR